MLKLPRKVIGASAAAVLGLTGFAYGVSGSTETAKVIAKAPADPSLCRQKIGLAMRRFADAQRIDVAHSGCDFARGDIRDAKRDVKDAEKICDESAKDDFELIAQSRTLAVDLFAKTCPQQFEFMQRDERQGKD